MLKKNYLTKNSSRLKNKMEKKKKKNRKKKKGTYGITQTQTFFWLMETLQQM